MCDTKILVYITCVLVHIFLLLHGHVIFSVPNTVNMVQESYHQGQLLLVLSVKQYETIKIVELLYSKLGY